jgi:hypothetical protein
MEQVKKGSDLKVLGIVLAVLVIINIALVMTGSLKVDVNGVGLMVGTGFTIAIFSFIFRDNALFKLAEHLYVGAAAGYLFHMVWYDNMIRDLYLPLFKPDAGAQSDLWLILPMVLGILLLCRLSRKLEFLARIPFAFMVGFYAGQSIPNSIASQILEQIAPTLIPVFGSNGFNFNALVILCGVISVLIYFFFSVEHTGVIGKVSRIGVWFLMISFGASFGYTVMARMSLLIGRISYLFRDWIPLIR